jgi:hypothetical protein
VRGDSAYAREDIMKWCEDQPELAKATVGTIRLSLLKLGAKITVSVRRILIAIAACLSLSRYFGECGSNVSNYFLPLDNLFHRVNRINFYSEYYSE